MPGTSFVLYGDRLHFHSRRGEEEAVAIRDWVNGRDLGPASIEQVPPSLEDVFVALLGADSPEGGRQ